MTMNILSSTRSKHLPKFLSYAVLCCGAFVLTACATSARYSRHVDTRPGTFLNPPKVGERITPRVGTVVCFEELDAIGMSRTGFFTQSCQTVTEEFNLIANTVEQRDVGEGLVWMIRTEYLDRLAWVPIPWHDWD